MRCAGKYEGERCDVGSSENGKSRQAEGKRF